ncbi:class I SAM-dependent DNA methyltransferase [Mesorhizobium sp.]|uniref:type I restriction-modification system subunit M n=1 Tax=Mesorhizobium sp. TaxID=1871066 RepID=UPI000FE6F589|nr:class I SAM-dependent DNA methyltransferase [Mesorhizobium sp.]RWP41739.1 MAG: SAM-dependent DNA methyltransferase [Mesorhizobium sp.]
MITGELRSKVDAVWNAFWAGGIANPLEVIEQITYLLFMRGLDEAEQLEENRSTRTGQPMRRRIFKDGKDGIGEEGGIAYMDMRWSRLKNSDAGTMFSTMSEHVFPFLRTMAEDGTAHAMHMKGARFTIPSPALLVKVVDLIDKLPMQDRDTKGDLYEYMLSKIASAGQNGQFRTPRHIIALMVEMTAPTPKDIICDPACGTCGFLVAAGEYLRDNHPKLFIDQESRDHFNEEMFHGFDFDQTMLRIGSMNMTLHGVEDPDIRYKDSLSEEHAGDEDRYSLVLANPPFAGSLDYETTAKDLLSIVKTKKTELLFMALFLKLLKPGGRAAVIVPDGVLFGSSTAHRAIRKMLVEDHRLDGIVKLPSGVFRPYAGVSTAIVLFTKTNSGGTDHVWFYDCQADGFSLDDKRNALLPGEKLGPTPGHHEAGHFVNLTLSDDDLAKNNLPDIAVRWADFRKNGLSSAEWTRARTAQSFCVPKADIAAAGYDLSINRYKEVVHEAQEHRPPKEIIAELKTLEKEIAQGLEELEAML